MAERGARPESLVAAVGPCIAQASYEVGPEFPAAVPRRGSGACRSVRPVLARRPFHVRPRGYVTRRLKKLGIGAIHKLTNDTCREEDRFFSYRRACLRGEKDYGREISVIALAP